MCIPGTNESHSNCHENATGHANSDLNLDIANEPHHSDTQHLELHWKNNTADVRFDEVVKATTA